MSVIGVGNLGSCIAYELANRGLVDEIVLIDILRDLAEGNAADIGQAIAFRNNTKVYAGDYSNAGDSQIIIISAGKPRTPEIKTRLDLLEVNKKIIDDVARNVREIGGEPVIITLTNPVDIMNYLLWRSTGFPRERVIGSAGMLDSARFRHILSKRYNVPVLEVEAYVIGEHGERQVPVFSKVKIRNERVEFTASEKSEIMEELRQSALAVISKKGATVYAPANNTVNMVEAILMDEKKTYICSAILNGEYGLTGVSIGVPVILGRRGIKAIIEWELNEDEREAFYSGASNIRRSIESVCSTDH
ncbi:MAG: malate dehydrogenase [Candidatus Bathyarchaeota archaeon]|nr:malate dehydrogenase [Candidatus Bathyarchaeota archaeon]